jgi:hypothetical protein
MVAAILVVIVVILVMIVVLVDQIIIIIINYSGGRGVRGDGEYHGGSTKILSQQYGP